MKQLTGLWKEKTLFNKAPIFIQKHVLSLFPLELYFFSIVFLFIFFLHENIYFISITVYLCTRRTFCLGCCLNILQKSYKKKKN